MNTKTTFQLLLLFIIGYATGKHSSKIAESIETTASSTEVTEVSKQTEMALDVNNTSTEGHSDVHPLIDFNNTGMPNTGFDLQTLIEILLVTNQMVWNKMHQLQQLFVCVAGGNMEGFL